MKLLCLLCCVVYATCFYIDVQELKKDEIIAGAYAPIHKVPYQASLEYKLYSICGAAIISELYLLLAAQCFATYVDIKRHGRFRVGTSFKESKGDTFRIKRMKIHESFDNETLDNDIALAELEEPLSFSKNVKPIPIAKPYESPRPNEKMIISGFGDIQFNFPTKLSVSTVLRLATVKILENSSCHDKNFYYELTEEMFCAEAAVGAGDAGGPGVINGTLAGIISTSGIVSSVYVKVSEHHCWIHKNSNLKVS